MNWNSCLDFDPNSPTDQHFSMLNGEGTYQNRHGMPFKTAEEFERHYYMLGDTRMASMWTLVGELDTALSVAARLDE
jgi:hypothetical protein